jgi:hypothetical protein
MVAARWRGSNRSKLKTASMPPAEAPIAMMSRLGLLTRICWLPLSDDRINYVPKYRVTI